jgi:hypothetical protein
MSNAVIVLITLGAAGAWKIVDFIKFVFNSKQSATAKNQALTQLVAWIAGVATVFTVAWTQVAHNINFVPGRTLYNVGLVIKLFLGVAVGSWASILYDFKKARDNTGSADTPHLFPKLSRRFGTTVLNPAPYDPTGGSTVPPGGSVPLGQATDPGHVLGTITITPQGLFIAGNVIAPGGSVPLAQSFAGSSAVPPGGSVAPGGPYTEPPGVVGTPVGTQQGPYPFGVKGPAKDETPPKQGEPHKP